VPATKRRSGYCARSIPETGIPIVRCRPRLRLLCDSNRLGESQLRDVRVSGPYALRGSLQSAFVYFLTSDGAGRAAFAAIARPNSEGLNGTGSMMSSGRL